MFNGYPLPRVPTNGVPRICTHRVRAAQKKVKYLIVVIFQNKISFNFTRTKLTFRTIVLLFR